MRIQHNIMAMNAYRNYSNNTSALSKNLERLSSGYKINRAGDDAAGLAISEKMRAQITGLEAAQKNVKDGISLVNTVEGAMQEIQDMLNRMVYLATQSSNGTYDNEVDRANLQKEVESLKEEINRIADSANFNGINLLDGSQEAKNAISGVTNVTIAAIRDGRLGVEAQAGQFSVDFSNVDIKADAQGDLTYTIFGQQLTLGTLNEGESMSGAAIAAKIVEQWNVLDDDTKTIHGALMSASVVNETTVMFDMANAPTEAWATAAGDGDSLNLNGNQAAEITVSTVKEPVDSTKGRLYAQGSFQLGAT